MLKNFRDRVFSAAIVPTSKDESDNNSKLNLFPNPTFDGRFTVNVNNSSFTSDSDISIYDIEGRMVKRIADGQNNKSISLEIPGIYIVIISDGQSKAYRKLIVE
jgi:hypothetical protein